MFYNLNYNKPMTSNISPFIEKLQQILNDPDNSSVISFNESNSRLQISNKKKLETILPKYFRHGKFESFVRQLNWYGFYKMNNKTLNCYSHPDLEKGNKLETIKSRRKNNSQRHSAIKNSEHSPAQLQPEDKPAETGNTCITYLVPAQTQPIYNNFLMGNQCIIFDSTQLQFYNPFQQVCPLYYTL